MINERQLINYLPEYMREAREFKHIMNAEQPEMVMLNDEIKLALDNQFISSLTEYGVKRWEKILDITAKATFTIDERKFTIFTRLTEQLPYTYRVLINMLAELCGDDGFKIELDTDNFTLNILVTLKAVNNINDVDLMLRRVCPANLIISISIEYNQHFKFKKHTHAEFKIKTYYKMRNEVI